MDLAFCTTLTWNGEKASCINQIKQISLRTFQELRHVRGEDKNGEEGRKNTFFKVLRAVLL
jgi:hypothetical protein